MRGGMRLTIHLGLLAGAGWLVAMCSGFLVPPAVLVPGLVQVALFAPAHETMHCVRLPAGQTRSSDG